MSHRAHYGQDRFSQDPMAAARFGIYTVAIAAFIVLMIKLRIVVSWLALVAGFAVFMLVLATMLFMPGSN